MIHWCWQETAVLMSVITFLPYCARRAWWWFRGFMRRAGNPTPCRDHNPDHDHTH